MKFRSTAFSGIFFAILILAIGCIALISSPGAQSAAAQSAAPLC